MSFSPEISQVTMLEANKRFFDLVANTTAKKERTLITESGKGIAVLVPLEDLGLLQKIEDMLDYQETIEALDESGENISLEQLKKELGLS